MAFLDYMGFLRYTINSPFDYRIPEVKAGETNTINASTTADIINAYDFTIEMQSEPAED